MKLLKWIQAWTIEQKETEETSEIDMISLLELRDEQKCKYVIKTSYLKKSQILVKRESLRY